MAKTEYGLQMYSVRDITKDSLEEALKKVAEMGYKYIEFAGFLTTLQRMLRIGLTNMALFVQAHIQALTK